MTPEDRIRAVFDEPVVPLNPPPGTWERIETGAARRRRNRRLRTAGAAAAAVVVLGSGVAWLGGLGGQDGTVQPARTPTPTTSESATDSATVPAPSPSATPLPTGTNDASATAAAGPVPPRFAAVSVTTVPGGYLYALGTAPCRVSPCTSVVRSTDGGETWNGIPAPRAELPPATDARVGGGEATADTVSEIRFATARHGWAFGGALWQTHDGGATWRRTPGIRGRVLDLATDGTYVWAVTTTCTGSPCGEGAQLLRSRVGESSFTAVRGLDLPGAAAGVHLLGGPGIMTLTFGGPESRLYLLRDGGAWQQAVTPCAPPGVHYEGELLGVAPPAAGGGPLVAFCGDPTTGGLNVVTKRSTDGGRTWPGRGDLVVPHGRFSATAATADDVVVATGNFQLGGVLRVSRDGGRRYTAARGDLPGQGWWWVGASGGERVLALPLEASAEIYVSTDAGATFVARPIR